MQTSTQKEVSNRGMQGVLDTLIEKKFDMNILLEGIPYDLEYLKKRHERIEWWVYCKIIANLRPYFTQVEFEEMNSSLVARGKYFEAVLFGFFLFGSNKLARTFSRQIWKLGESQFSNIKQKTEFLDKNKIRIYAILEEGYEFPAEFAYFTKGTWDELASLIGRKRFKVEFVVTKQLVIFNVSWDSEGFLYKIGRIIRWFFNVKRALFEVTDTHAEMLQRYDQLQESKWMLEKQTTRLKTAYEISTSIRQKIQINDTLNAIVNTLLKVAELTAVRIALFKDIEDNEIKIEVHGGMENEFTAPIRREIIVNDKHIGDLFAYSGLQSDYKDLNELLDHISPIIDITVNNALVLRAIIDYRDNLEQKVTVRTNELQTARDKLETAYRQLKEAQLIQNRFFTNISHEFRTPLTLILGPAKRILERTQEDESKSDADLIHRSAKKLNRLVDELLEISKIEAGEMKLNASPQNLVSLTKDIVLQFYSFAERKNITLKFNCEENEIKTYLDKDKYDKILNNVLSNALKFTAENGKVEIRIQKNEKTVDIIITDTGIGIAKDQLNKIFDRFYQVDGSHTREYEGTGIGLSLTKELVELHKGIIKVESAEGKGSTFRLIFPLGKDHLRAEEICTESIEKEKSEIELDLLAEQSHKNIIDIESFVQHEKPLLLIVEDNADVRKYLQGILNDEYMIIESEDGEDGLKKSFKHIPDLIISDIMMPKLEGFQLCNKLKTDFRTSHIPIIMLTAKATINDKINGLKIGADDYIMKPFEAGELRARIKNLLEQRKRLHDHFRKYGLAEIETQKISSFDQKLVEKAIEVINKNLSNHNLSIETLAADLAVSKWMLNKKLSALTGDTPAEFIKRVRLSRAAKLIEQSTGNISEIALEVGFSNPAYFAECFKKQFGISPSQYHQSSRTN